MTSEKFNLHKGISKFPKTSQASPERIRIDPNRGI